MAIKKVVKSSVSQQVFDQLREQILSGSWKPGQKLPSRKRAGRPVWGQPGDGAQRPAKAQRPGAAGDPPLGRAPLCGGAGAQAALNQLVPMLYLGQETLRDILTFRRMVEGPICEIACRRATDREIAGLRQLVDQMERAVGDLAAFARLDSAFHEQLAQLTRSSHDAADLPDHRRRHAVGLPPERPPAERPGGPCTGTGRSWTPLRRGSRPGPARPWSSPWPRPSGSPPSTRTW